MRGRHRKAIAKTVYGLDIARIGDIVSQCPPQQGNDPIQRSWGDVLVSPYGIEQSIPIEQLLRMLDKLQKQRECFRFKLDRATCPEYAMRLRLDSNLVEQINEWSLVHFIARAGNPVRMRIDLDVVETVCLAPLIHATRIVLNGSSSSDSVPGAMRAIATWRDIRTEDIHSIAKLS